MDTKLKEDIEVIVSNIFSEKAQADQKQKTQEALNESAEMIESLTQSLEDVKTELSTAKESVKEELADKDSKISETTTELEAAQKDLEETKEALKTSEESLDNMKKDQIAEARMAQLTEVKVAMLNNIESQTAKVREMSEEDFDAYKVERVELRDEVKKELEAEAKAQADVDANTNTETQDDDDTTTTTTEANLETASTEDDDTTAPANIPVGQALASAMNFENKPSEDMVSKYTDLGKAMAASMTPDSDK